MQIDPRRVVMVGDSEHCDGGCQFFGSTYMKVLPHQRWDQDLYKVLGEKLPTDRVLCNLYEFNLIDNVVYTLLRHLSEPLSVGDTLLLGNKEHVVTECEPVTKEQILAAKHDYYRFRVRPA